MAVIVDDEKHRIIFDDRKFHCGSCSGTGLFTGFFEPDSAATACSVCEGTGLVNYVQLPASQNERLEPPDRIKRVLSNIHEGVPRRHVKIKEWIEGKRP